MTSTTTKVFKSGNSLAVRIPRSLGLEEGAEVVVMQAGRGVSVQPKPKMSPAELVARLREIGPPEGGVQKRPPFLAPLRKGL